MMDSYSGFKKASKGSKALKAESQKKPCLVLAQKTLGANILAH
jgi:hypothetical protein